MSIEYDEFTIVVADKIYVPIEHIDLDKADKLYVHEIFKDIDCIRCPNRPERPNFECEQCQHPCSLRVAGPAITKIAA